MEEQAKLLADLTATISFMNSKLEEMHPVVLDLSTWRPMIERNMDNLRAEVGDLRMRMSEVVRSSSSSPTGAAPPPLRPFTADAPPLLPTPPKPAGLASSALQAADGGDGHGQFGHGDASNQRGTNFGDLASPKGAPAKGTFPNPCAGYDSSDSARNWNCSCFPAPPRVDFPLFDGENPRAWRLRCEAYFQVCNMHPETWVNCAAMYFTDDALAWL
jgi:hypothetical protein